MTCIRLGFADRLDNARDHRTFLAFRGISHWKTAMLVQIVLHCSTLIVTQSLKMPEGRKKFLSIWRGIDWCGPVTPCGHLHTLCDFPNDGPSEDCENYVKMTLSPQRKLMILHFLNHRRNLAAGGKDHLLPTASGMRMLEWDETLSYFAQRWVDQCFYHPLIFKSGRPTTDFCRDHPDYHVVQFNMFLLGEKNPDGDWAMFDLINFLINWISSINEEVVNHIVYSGYIPFEDKGAVMYYALAHQVGCGAATFDVYSTNSTQYNRITSIVCNMGPVQNFYLLDRYYAEGIPCSACPSGTQCDPQSNFKYLCRTSDQTIQLEDIDGEE